MDWKAASISIIAMSLFAGCASDIMQGMVGKDITEVMVARGAPANVFDMPDGRRAFQWRIDSAYVMPTNTTVTAYGNIATARTTGGGVLSDTCFYTLYGKPNPRKSYTVIGFEKPDPFCE
jgi:hypothetical protein